MHLKTPKRYRAGRHERRLVGSWRGIRNLWLVLLLGAAGYWIYNNQEHSRQWINSMRGEIGEISQDISTAMPRQPTPTVDVSNALIDANTAYQTGDFQRAITQYYEVIKGSPNDLEAHYRLVLLLTVTSNLGSNTEQMAEAQRVADLAINANPEAPDGWAIKAMTLVWSDQFGEAIAYAQQALEIDPDFVQAKAFLAEAYWELQRQEQAATTIAEAVEYLRGQGSAPSETVAAVFRAQGYIAERQLERPTAIEAYEVAYRAAPYQSYIALELALSYFGNGQTDEAIALLNRALDQTVGDPVLLFQLGSIYLNVGQNEDAQQTFQRCIDANPTYAPCLSYLGGLQFFAGRYPQAVTNLEASIANGSQDWSDWLQLGQAHVYMLRCDLAIPVLREGYMRVAENADRQERFASALRECGVQPVDSLSPEISPTATP